MILNGNTFVITGASRGIGRSIALSFAKEGANLILSHYNDSEEMSYTLEKVEKYGSKATVIEVNFFNSNEIISFASQVFRPGEKITGLINNAGIICRDNFFEIEPNNLNAMFQINCSVPLILSQKCSHLMINEKTQGSIINISSIASRATFETSIGYSASKAALNKWTENAALNLSPYKIRCNAIAPGVTNEGMNSNLKKENPKHWAYINSNIPLSRCGTGKDIADMAVFLASEKSSWITGKIFEVDGGQTL